MNLRLPLTGAWADPWVDYAWAGFWQSTVLIAVLWLADLGLRRRLRPVLRYGMWMLVLVKLLLPPSLSLPTGAGYWIGRSVGAEAGLPRGDWVARELPDSRGAVSVSPDGVAAMPTPEAPLRVASLLVLGWGLGAVVFLGLVVWRTVPLGRWQRRAAKVPGALTRLLAASQAEVGLSRTVALGWTGEGQSPALCGWWRPTLLLPRGLAVRLSEPQLRAVFLHELVHARRGDVWVNALQLGLQILWWWHPLVWLANARLRAIREEVVDDEVAFRLGEDSVIYPETLLEVAKAAVFRPAQSLGLLGIVESRSALRARIERLLVDPPTCMPRLGRWGFTGIVLLGLVLLPMARGRSTTTHTRLEPQAPVGVVTAVQVTPKLGGERQVGVPSRVPTNALPERGTVVPRRDVDPWTGQAQWSQAVLGGTPYPGITPFGPADLGTWPGAYPADPVGAATVDTPKLVTRTYRLDYSVVIPALERRLGRELGEDFGAWSGALREALEQVGFSTRPPNAVFLTMRKALLMIRAPVEQVNKVDSLITELADQPPQILIEFRFLELGEAAFRSLPLEGVPLDRGSVDPAGVRFLTEAQHRTLLEAVKRRADVRDLAAPRVLTLSGRSAEIRQSESATNAPVYVAAVHPEVLPDKYFIRMETRVEWTQRMPEGPWTLEKPVQEDLSWLGPPGGVAATKVPGFVFVHRSATNTAVLGDGYSQVLGDLGPGAPPLGLKRVIVLVTVTLVDRAGNPLHSKAK